MILSNKSKISLSQSLVYYLIAFGSIIAMLTTSISYSYLTHISKIQYEKKLEEYLKYLKDSLELPVWRMDKNALDKICISFAKNDVVGLIQVLDENGEIFFETGSLDRTGLIIGEVTIFYEKEIVGKIVLGLTPSVYIQRNKELLWTSIFIATAMILGLALSIKIILEILLKKPLDDLIHSIKNIASGDYSQPKKEYKQLEMSVISEEFDRMVEQVISREKSLIKAKEELESGIKMRSQLEQQLQQAQKMEAIGTLAGGIAHDFNNILSPIQGFAEILADDFPEGNKHHEKINSILKAAIRAAGLVQQILAFSRQKNQEYHPIQPHLVINEALKLLRSSIPTTIEIKHNIPEYLGSILADQTQIHQIVMNLCTNAYHAMREKGGVLIVELSKVIISREDITSSNMQLDPGTYLIFGVTDTGHGMDGETVGKMFNPYFSTKPKGEGTGFGLSIVHGIVKSYGGFIKVYSEPGRGTTIRIYFPSIETEVDHAKIKSETKLPTGDERILLVDDEEPVLNIMKQLIESLGYKVVAFDSSPKALETFQADPKKFDLVITDVTMPQMTGLELARRLFMVNPKMLIILCTGYNQLITNEKAKALGIKEYLLKPVLRTDLSKAIRKVLDNGY